MNFVLRKVHHLNRDFLIDQAKRYKKLEHLAMAYEDYKMKDYFVKLDLHLARLKFHQRALTVKSCVTHFPSDRKFLEGGFFCPCKKKNKDIMTLFHWRKCEMF